MIFNTLNKILKLIKISDLKINYLFVFILMIISFLFELITLGSLIPIISYVVNPELVFNFIEKNELNNDYVDQLLKDKENFAQFLFTSIILIFSVKIIYSIFYSWYLNNFAIKFERNITKKVLLKYYQNFNFYFSQKKEDLFTSITFRTTRIGVSSIFLSSLIVELFMMLFIISFIIFNSSKDALLMISSVGFIFLIFVLISNKIVKSYSFKRSMYLQKKNNLMKDFLDGIREIIIFDSGQKFFKKYDEFNLKQLKPQRDINIFNSLPRIVFEGVVFLIIIIIVFYTTKNSNNPDQIFLKLGIFVALMVRLLPSINRILLNFNNLKFCHEPVEKIYNDISYNFNQIEEIYEFNDTLSLSDIEFKYGNLKIFDKLNFTIKKGEKILIIGDSGTGKTTLLDIIIGLKKPLNGNIFVDGKKFYTSSEWMKNISLVPQQSFLYNDTIKFNVTFQEDERKIDEKLYNQSLSIAGLDKVFINNNYNNDTVINLNNPNFSGGQKQRISLARAIYKNPSILILDEATNSLDQESENIIAEKLLKIKDMTVIMVSHNRNFQNKFNTIYKIENFKIIKC